MRRFLRNVYDRAIRPLTPASVDETIQMAVRLRYCPNIHSPRTFNEKIAHRKLFTNDPRFSQLSDKWRVRDYVREKIGDEYLVPLYDCVTSPWDIDLSSLPQSFVVKATHDSGTVVIVDDRDQCDWKKIGEALAMRLATSYGASTNEYWYKDIPPRLIVEKRLTDRRFGVPLDFKFLVFHGSVKVVQVIQRHGISSQRFYDRSWNPLSVRRPRAVVAKPMQRPRQLDRMIEIAETLGDGFDFVRVDLFAPDDERIFFGEMTFAPAAGRMPFIPRTFDWELGSYW